MKTSLYKKTALIVFAISLFSLFQVQLSNAYTDLTGGEDYEEAVYSLTDQGVIEGYPDDTFRMNLPIIRAEYIKILVHSKLGYDPITFADDCFPDVAKDKWYASYVCYAKENGIIEGYPDGTFGPANEINFAEGAKIIVNTFEVQKTTPLGGKWYSEYVESMAMLNYIPPSIFRADARMNRGEMAESVYRVQENIQDRDSTEVILFQGLESCPSTDSATTELLDNYVSNTLGGEIFDYGYTCEMDDGRQIYSTSFAQNGEVKRLGVLAGADGNIIGSEELSCLVMGDIPAATLEISSDQRVFTICSGGDAGWFAEDLLEVFVSEADLTFSLINQSVIGGEPYVATAETAPEPTPLPSALKDYFIGYASELGLDDQAFEACYDESRYDESIASDIALASDNSVYATPTFFINGEMLVGAHLFATFQTLINEKLLEDISYTDGIYSTQGEPFFGDASAPVTIVEFSDFQCPFCQRFTEDTLSLLKTEYIDAGKVKVIFRDFPLESLHLNARSAANAAQCAFEQDRFEDYHDMLFSSQSEWSNK